MDYLKLVSSIDEESNIVDFRRHFHQNPELGYEGYKTSALIQNELTKIGIEIVPTSSNTGVIGLSGTVLVCNYPIYSLLAKCYKLDD